MGATKSASTRAVERKYPQGFWQGDDFFEDRGEFRMIVDRDGMEPLYSDGQNLAFEDIDLDCEIPTGEDYYFSRKVCEGTFKHLVRITDDSYVLAARNQDQYPGTHEVPIDEITRIARVSAIVVPAPVHAKPLKIRAAK